MEEPDTMEKHAPGVIALKVGLLLVWVCVTFGVSFFARDLQFQIGGWPFGYWFAAQGAILAFIAIVVAYAWAMKRLEPGDSQPAAKAKGG